MRYAERDKTYCSFSAPLDWSVSLPISTPTACSNLPAALVATSANTASGGYGLLLSVIVGGFLQCEDYNCVFNDSEQEKRTTSVFLDPKCVIDIIS
jgi:hypothetical protein